MAPTPSSGLANSQKPFTICTFCGANPGVDSIYATTAESLARVLHENSMHLVYGGGTVGLMGVLSRTLVSLSGPQSVHGIIPRALVKFEQGGKVPPKSEYGHTTVVEDMHTRKHRMAKEADAFVAMPGGFGTMEELFEVVTWNQLGIHDRPVVLLNVNGFYNGLLAWIEGAVKEGFVSQGLRGIIVEAKTPEEVIEKIRTYTVAPGRFDLNWASEGKDEGDAKEVKV